MIKFKDINYPRRKEKEIITNLPNEIWKDIDDGYKVSNYGSNDNDYSIKHKSKIVRIYNDVETIYNSINEAAIKNNVSASAIYNCLYGKSKTCGGYEWTKR